MGMNSHVVSTDNKIRKSLHCSNRIKDFTCFHHFFFPLCQKHMGEKTSYGRKDSFWFLVSESSAHTWLPPLLWPETGGTIKVLSRGIQEGERERERMPEMRHALQRHAQFPRPSRLFYFFPLTLPHPSSTFKHNSVHGLNQSTHN